MNGQPVDHKDILLKIIQLEDFFGMSSDLYQR